MKRKTIILQLTRKYSLVFFVTLLGVLLFELICCPFSATKLANDADVKTVGSMMLLTDGSPQQLQIYHRAFILPRYRLDCILDIVDTDDGFKMANVDLFQKCVVSVENNQIVLYAKSRTGTPYVLIAAFLSFTILSFQTCRLIEKRLYFRGQ